MKPHVLFDGAGHLRALPLLAGALSIIVLLTAGGIALEYQKARNSEAARLEAISKLRTGQVSRWLRERTGAAAFLKGSQAMAGYYTRWRNGDANNLELLVERAVDIRKSSGYQGVLILDAEGTVLAAEAGVDRSDSAELREAGRRAIASGQPERTELYGYPGPAPAPRLDVVVPLGVTGTPARGAIAFRVDPRVFLFPTLTEWPVPTKSGMSLMVRRVGDSVVGSLGQRPVPLTAEALAPRALRGAEPMRIASDGVDFQGTPVLGVVSPIEDSVWFLVTKVDRAEIRAAAAPGVLLVLGLGVLALLASAIGVFRLRDLQRLRTVSATAKAQAEQLRGLQLLDSIARESTDVIYAKDREGRYTLYNAASGRVFGGDPAGMIGRRVEDVLPAAAARAVAAMDERVMAEDRTISSEEVFALASGPRTYFITRGPLHDSVGAVTGMFGISRDVTERNEAARESLRSAALIQAVEDSVFDHMAVLDRGGVIVNVNESWRQFGRTTAAAAPGLGRRDDVGTDYLDVCRRAAVAAPEAAEVARGIESVLAGEAPGFTFEYDCRSHDRDNVFRATVTPLRVDSGGAVVVHSDITERRRNEQELERHRHRLEDIVAERSADLQQANTALAAAEAFLRDVTDHIPAQVAYWDRDGYCRFVNKVYLDWHGLVRENFVGRHENDILGKGRIELRRPYVRAALAGEAQSFESEEKKADGSWAYSWVQFMPDRQGSEVRGFFVLATDVSAVKKSELQLHLINQELTDARDRAEAATSAKSAFLANMSHEIRTPMNAIIGLTHLMRRDIQEPAQRSRLGKVSDAAHHLLSVINDILDLSKIESGKLKLELVDFLLDAMLMRVCALVADAARAKGLEIVIDTTGLPKTLHGDVTRLSQALLNLLSNAVKFTARGAIAVRGAIVERRPDSLLLRFEVSDTGVGIAPENLSRLFSAFEQADSTTTRKFGGTGLGLSITRQLAGIMGGEAGVESELGVGSRFWFTARIGLAREEFKPVNGSIAAGARALLADDLPEAREALAEMLRRLGLRVDTAESGAEALLLADAADAAGDSYLVAVLDWKMPGLDGVETGERLKAGGRRPNLRCVIVTAHDDAAMWTAARQAGIRSVLLKPVSGSTLQDALTEAMVDADRPIPEPPPVGDAFQSLRSERRGARVLLAEDNLVNQEVGVELLRSAGLEVDVANNGAEAVAMALARDYDLVLMDVQMPELDGMQATRALRAIASRRALPIIAMTANAFGEDRAACIEAGMNDHVAKPVDPDELYATLLRWLPARAGAETVAAGQVAAGAAVDADGALSPPASTTSASPAAVDDITARLVTVEGFDLARGLALFEGNLAIYLRVLRRFMKVYAAGMPEIDSALANHSLAELGGAGHSLRGAAASIGASRLEQVAGQLEAMCAAGDPTAAAATEAAALQMLLLDTVARLVAIVPMA